MTRGRFITLEGGEGVGKSTQLTAIADALRARGLTVVTTREPGGSAGAEAIRELLMQGGDDRWNARAEALLFAAARADHVARTIVPALEAGSWVVCDRFVDSSRAYQGGGGGLSDADVMALHRIGSAGLLPDRTLLFELDAGEGDRRVAARGGEGDRMGNKPAVYQDRMRHAFRAMADAEPDRFRIIDAAGTPGAVTAAAMHALSDMLP